MIYLPSPNKNPRGGYKIDTIVLHGTGGPLWPSINWLRNPDSNVSSHYVIAKDGIVYQLVEEDYMAWHAGNSQMPDGRTGVNWFSIGIELVNDNSGNDPYPESQIDSLVKLIENINNRLDIKRENIVTHAEIAVPIGRKVDPVGLDKNRILDRIYRKDYFAELAVSVRWNVEEAVREIERGLPSKARNRLLKQIENLYRLETYLEGEE